MQRDNQLVGNIGLFYVCYELSKRGWNCLPTTRNAKGVDIVIYSQDAQKKLTIQVKALTQRSAVPFGSNPHLIADLLIIVRNVFDSPIVYIMKIDEVRERLHKTENKKGEVAYWLEYKDYEDFKDRWELIESI
ncbi:MAG: hypothetical protein CBR30_06825 [Dictyoglomus sp. NZ13-RE01]|nr:MAG: hypothetical protein CBR30_06825 [Dictyoglomus sp. NZ13-RE01]